jgi:alpha-2-macroglobulin
MQTRDGGLSYWPGGHYSELWPSAYVGQLLLVARRGGYTPEPRFVEELLKYLKANLYAGGHESGDDQSENENMRAMFCHVLAGFGQPHEGWQARLAERPERLDMAGRAHLAAAWLETGQKDRARAALPPDTIELAVANSTGSPTASQVHQQATLLAVLLDLDRDHPWIPLLVRKLESARTAGHWGTTLENATALAALARYQLSDAEPSTFSGQITVGTAKQLAFDDKQPATARFEFGADPVKFTSNGTGSIFVTVQTRGLATDGHLESFDRQLRIRRIWTDRTGAKIKRSKLRVGDVVYVEVRLTAPGLANDETIANVAIVDALPAGMEVEHPALATSAGSPAQPDDVNAPDRVEFRDDRVIIFSSAGSTRRSFRYALRVVSVGRFTIPPIEASCMYNAGLASRHGGGTLEIKR